MTLSSTIASAETLLSANDVSILLEAPKGPGDPRVRADKLLPETLLKAARETLGGVPGAAGILSANQDGSEGIIPKIDLSLFENRVKEWHVASLRIDPGAPGLGEAFSMFGRHLQIRLVVQPVDSADRVKDEAIHLVYGFSRPLPETDPGFRLCPLHAMPDAEGMAAFGRALDDLVAIKTALAAGGIVTDNRALGVHPAFDRPDTATKLTRMLQDFVTAHLPPQRLVALSVAGLPKSAPEPWIFAALRRDRATGGFAALSSPALQQPSGGEKPKVRQMLSFLVPDGEVVPPASTRNLLPVDCLMNPILAAIPGAEQPGADDGTSTTALFGGSNSAEAARKVADVIADPARAHFFNTDCVSCHTETRRDIDAASDMEAKALEIAAAHDLDPAVMPANMPFSHRNVRAFGWFPGFSAGDDAHETAVRRTATETAEVLECLNHGDWKDLSTPCVKKELAEVIDQGWGPRDRSGFYHRSQGSAIMPLTYFLALETAKSKERFASPDNLARYGFLRSYDKDSVVRFDLPRLPVGMTVTERDNADHVGLNCAACHSADVMAGGKRIRVDGAPSALDFDRFIVDLAEAVREAAQLRPDATGQVVPSPKLERFIKKVAVIEPSRLADGPKKLVEDVLAFATEFAGEMALRRPAFPSGPGRVDALTQIVNALAVKDLDLQTNHATPVAPTSYPALWLAPRLEYVQWNMAVADPLNRNVGQALGVFGKAELLAVPPFASSADLKTMALNEQWLDKLQPPAWPADLLGEIDMARAEAGRDLFKAECLGCHNAPPFEMTKAADNAAGDRFIKITPIAAAKVGTDQLYTETFTKRWASVTPIKELLQVEGDVLPAAVFLGKVVPAVTRAVAEKGIMDGEQAPAPRLRPAGHRDCLAQGTADQPCGYLPPQGGGALKAGPLLGLFATGPYLHNGSVRTVFEVISPPEERSDRFWIGDRTVDARHLGFESTETKGAFLFDTSLPGNGKSGHDFWKQQPLAAEDRLAIVEYLKDPLRFPIQE